MSASTLNLYPDHPRRNRGRDRYRLTVSRQQEPMMIGQARMQLASNHHPQTTRQQTRQEINQLFTPLTAAPMDTMSIPQGVHLTAPWAAAWSTSHPCSLLATTTLCHPWILTSCPRRSTQPPTRTLHPTLTYHRLPCLFTCRTTQYHPNGPCKRGHHQQHLPPCP